MQLKQKILLILTCIVIATGNASAQTDSTKYALITTGKKPDFLKPIPANQYAKGLGFFCRQELAWDKKLPMPVKFRVGNIDDCNYLEQKTGYKLPQTQ